MIDLLTILRLRCSLLARKPRPIFVEPWGKDYWLFPGDEIELVAEKAGPLPVFDLVEDDETTQIFLKQEGRGLAVHYGGQPIESGFQRAKFAGVVSQAFYIRDRGVVVVSDRPWQMSFANGDQVRLIIRAVKTLPASVRLELMTTGHIVNENPLGLFLGPLDIDISDIPAGAPLFRLEPAVVTAPQQPG